MNNPSTLVVDETPSSLGPESAVQPTRRKRGFACMDPELVRQLARRGGVAAHKAGKAHQFTSEEAKVAGRKGVLATHGMPRIPLLEERRETTPTNEG